MRKMSPITGSASPSDLLPMKRLEARRERQQCCLSQGRVLRRRARSRRIEPASRPDTRKTSPITSSSRTPYPSLPRRLESSLIPSLLLSAKDLARLTCSLASALTTVRSRCHSFAVSSFLCGLHILRFLADSKAHSFCRISRRGARRTPAHSVRGSQLIPFPKHDILKPQNPICPNSINLTEVPYA